MPALTTLLMVFAVGGCGSSTQNEYTEASKTAMLRACAEDDDDPNLIEVCTCAEAQIEQNVPYSEFADWEKRLAAGEKSMPNRLASIIKDCIWTVSETR